MQDPVAGVLHMLTNLKEARIKYRVLQYPFFKKLYVAVIFDIGE
jgi:hypothetical protein